jgi:hypothetical protein
MVPLSTHKGQRFFCLHIRLVYVEVGGFLMGEPFWKSTEQLISL